MVDRPLRRLAALARPQRFFFCREIHRERINMGQRE
jgi:hypothetical protein